MVQTRALLLIDQLDVDSEGPYAKGKNVRVAANGSHGWQTAWNVDVEGSQPRPVRVAFSLVVERSE